MRLLTALLTLTITASTAVHARQQQQRAIQEIDIPESKNGAECDKWSSSLLAADTDNSGGISSTEFYNFLTSISDPPYVEAYFDQHDSFVDLPWIFKVAHKSLACRCRFLGLGEDCCEGPNAEVPLLGLSEETLADLTDSQKRVASEFKSELCNTLGQVFDQVIPVPIGDSTTTTVAATEAPPETTEVPETTETEPPTSGKVYQCVDASICNDNEPSDDADSSGWTETGVCGGVISCPDAYNGETDYGSGDQVFTALSDEDDDGDDDEDTTELTTATTSDETTRAGMTLDIIGSVLDYSSFDYSIISNFPNFLTAQKIMDNVDDNRVLGEVIKAFGMLANEKLGAMSGGGGSVTEEGKKKRGLRVNDEDRKLQGMGSLHPVEVTDIACPAGLVYAPKDAYCLNFKFNIEPADDMTVNAEILNNFAIMLQTAIDEDGELYDHVLKANPDTVISGLGSPGKGIDYTGTQDDEDDKTTVKSEANAAGDDDSSSGLGTPAIVAIILCIIIVPMAIVAMYARYRKVQNDQRLERLREYQERQNSKSDLETGANTGGFARAAPPPSSEPAPTAAPQEDDESSVPSVWSDKDGKAAGEDFVDSNKDVAMTAGSALAAMGTAGAAAAMIKKTESDDSQDSKAEIRKEVRYLVKETNTPKTAEELMNAYKGRELELVGHLRKMKEKQQDDIKAEITKLVERTKPGKTAEELLTAYAGREEELAKNLRKMKSKQDKAMVAELVEKTNPGKTADELLTAYAGREEELVTHLKKLAASRSS